MSDDTERDDEDLARELDAMRSLYAREDGPSSELDARIRAAARRAPHIAPARPPWRDPRWLTGLATAAALVLSVSVFYTADPQLGEPAPGGAWRRNHRR